MAEFGPEISSDVVATCQEGIGEATEALERAFDAKFEIGLGEAGTFDAAATQEELASPGLMIALAVGATGALLIVPESSGLLPDWYAEPDATGVSKLTTLAQELGMVLLPEEFMPEDFQAARVADLHAAIGRGELTESAAALPITLTSGENSGAMTMLWPAGNLSAVFESASTAESESPEASEAAAPVEAAASGGESSEAASSAGGGPPQRIQYDDLESGIRQLPSYSRSLLKIKVPVIVSLASTKLDVNRIVELGPGSIIQFDKSCEETLSLEVGNQEIAVGEAVKVGDKFGLRVTSMIMPEERFWVVRGKRETASR